MSSVGMISNWMARSIVAQPKLDAFAEMAISQQLGPELLTAIDEIDGLTNTLLCGIKPDRKPQGSENYKAKFAAIRQKTSQELETGKPKQEIIKNALDEAVAIYKEVYQALGKTQPADWADESTCYFRSTLHPDINEVVARKASGDPKYLLSWKTTKGIVTDRVKREQCSIKKPQSDLKACDDKIVEILSNAVKGLKNSKELLSKLK